MNISIAIKQVRSTLGIKQYEMAELLGISQTYLSQLEGGLKIPSFDVIEKYNKISKVPIPIIMWQSLEIKDVQKHKRRAYQELKPLIDNLINQIF